MRANIASTAPATGNLIAYGATLDGILEQASTSIAALFPGRAFRIMSIHATQAASSLGGTALWEASVDFEEIRPGDPNDPEGAHPNTTRKEP